MCLESVLAYGGKKQYIETIYISNIHNRLYNTLYLNTLFLFWANVLF